MNKNQQELWMVLRLVRTLQTEKQVNYYLLTN